MILPDVNVLIYALRAGNDHHTVCRTWLDGVLAGDSQFGLSTLVLSAVVRITTNPRLFRDPNTTDEAFAYCDALLAQPHCARVEPGERHWEIFKRLCTESRTRGPRISDAWLAALAIEHRCTFVTLDSDFARFPGLAWRRPDSHD